MNIKDYYNKMINKITSYINLIIFVIFIVILIALSHFIIKSSNLEKENKALYQELNVKCDVVNCYLCGNEVEIKPVNNSFYIECPNCKMRTNFFDSKYELINYWNKSE